MNETMDFRRITLSITGTAASTREYELLKTARGMKAALYDGPWNFNKMIRRNDCRMCQGTWSESQYRKVAEKLQRLGVEKWDGFCGSDPDVLDGEMFSLEIVLLNGKMIHAHGCNAYPEGYGEFLACLEEAACGPLEY